MPRRPKPTKAKGHAKSARPAPTRAARGARDPATQLAEALKREAEAHEQQAATSEILHVISRSPADVQPVFDAIVRSAARLCGAYDASIFRVEGDRLAFVAHHGPIAQRHGEFSLPLVRGTVGGRSVLDSRPIQVADLQTEDREFPDAVENARRFGFHTILSVPLLREGVALGGIQLRRREVQPFSERQVALLQTFADQAVIAIENVRLFTELQQKNRAVTESLEQQTATSEILRVISRSPTDVQPVFDAIVESARRLCGAIYGGVYRFDGELIHAVAHAGFTAEQLEAWRRTWPRSISAGGLTGTAIRSRAVVRVADIETETHIGQTAETWANVRARGVRSVVALPMFHHGDVIGAIGLAHPKVDAFSDAHVELLQTFADQAVIAVENVRLFTELQQKNHALTESLDQQTATSEILRAISHSHTDTQPVFDVIAESAERLLQADVCGLFRVENGQIHEVSSWSRFGSQLEGLMRQRYPRPLDDSNYIGQAILRRDVVHIPDMEDPATPSAIGLQHVGFRSQLVAPLLRGDEPIGGLAVVRRAAGRFSDEEIRLLQTFADQAVIAIENVRLFTELQQKNHALTESLEQQTATSEILRAMSGSLTDLQPVFDTIVRSGLRLLGGYSASMMLLRDGDLLDLMAYTSTSAKADASLADVFPMPLRNLPPGARAVRDRRPHAVEDVASDPDVTTVMRETGRARGWHSNLFIPMLRKDVALGLISITRREPGPFAADEIALIETFADQAVIAIENVRLFKELQARTQELTRSVGQLTALGEVGQAVSSSLDLETVLTTIVSRAVQLSGLDGGTVFEYDEASEEFRQRATTGALRVLAGRAAVRKGEGVVGQTAVTLEPVQVPDIHVAGAYESRLREGLVEAGVRAIIAVPIIREGRLLGGFAVNRNTPGEFPPATVDLLRTFATQSALAIQNARLFLEIADKSAQLEAASRHKSEFLANMSHELRTPLNAILGFSEVLSDRMFGELNDKQAEYLQDIHASGRHLLSLINDILDLSKIEAGRMELELSEFDLPSAIDNALILVRERAGRRGIALGSTVDKHLGSIRGDERKVKQVLLNLLSNALKFTPEGGRIDVRAALNDGLAELSVTDTGVGISPEDQAVIFEEFRQVGAADKKVEGTGLGLSLSRKFIELHGGRIWVTSEIGHGSTFTFTLPARRED